MTSGAPRTGREDRYRQRWAWDSVAWGTHCVDCYPGNCSYRVFTGDGTVRFEEAAGTFAPVEPGVPDKNPMGCNKGAAWSRQLDNPDRITTPLKRVGPRGSGEWEPIGWEEALGILAGSIIDTIETAGPQAVLHEGTPEMTTVVPTHRFMNLLGGTITDFNATTNDFNVGLHITFGKYSPVSSVDDWFHSDLILVWHLNPSFTRIPHAHFAFEARYRGAEVVMFAPDYNASAMHCDLHVPVEPGSDAALALAMCQVILEEGLEDREFVAEQTDLGLLVRDDTGRFLRESDLDPDGRDDQFFTLAKGIEPHQVLNRAGRGSLKPELPVRLEGSMEVTLADGSRVNVRPVISLLREHLDSAYTPEAVAGNCGVHPDTIRNLARKVAANRTNVLFGAAASKYYHGDLIERSLCLLLALTGNWGKKGTGIRSWSAGMFDGPAIAMAKAQPGVEGTEAVIMGLEMLAAAQKAADPTATDEIASEGLTRLATQMVPPFFHWWANTGYRERWTKEDWHDPSMPRPFESLVEEALDAGWWEGTTKMLSSGPPRVLIECGGNMLRRTRGGRSIVLEHLWPKLDLVAVIDQRMSATGLNADLILPAAQHYEKIDFHIPTPHLMHLTFSDRAQAPAGEALTEWELFARLAEALATEAQRRGLESYKDANGVAHRYDALWSAYTLDGHYADEERLADEMLRDSAQTGALPEGTDLPSARRQGHIPFSGWGILPYAKAQASPFPVGETHTPYRNHVEKGDPYPTLTRRAQFYIDHPWFLEAGEALPCHKEPPAMGGDHPLKITSGHCRWSIHRMNIGNRLLLQTHRGTPHAVVNPDDAAARGVSDHDEIEVFNATGGFVVRAKISPSVRPGQIIVYNGWESYQFPGWRGPNEIEGGMVKWLHLAGGYGHLNYTPTAWQPATVDRATRVDFRPAADSGTTTTTEEG